MFKELKELGMNNYEAKALAALLKEELTPKELSKRAGIPLGKVYSVLKPLESRGVVQRTEGKPCRLFVESPSNALKDLLKARQAKDEALFESVRSTASTLEALKGGNSRFFDLGTTLDDARRIQSRAFNEAEKEFLQILNVHHRPGFNRENKALWEREIAKAVKRGVKFKSIYPVKAPVPRLLDELMRETPESFQVRRLDTTFPRCDVVDSRKALVKLVNEDPANYGGVIFVENEAFARHLKKVFEQLWLEARE